MRILIADDHALFRDSLKSLLAARGHEVLGEAKDGRQAVELAHRLRPDVVLMDLSMPELDGLSTTKLIVADLPEVKVVVLTASDDDQNLFEAIKSGAQGYVLKNLEAAEFFSELEGLSRGEPALSPRWRASSCASWPSRPVPVRIPTPSPSGSSTCCAAWSRA